MKAKFFLLVFISFLFTTGCKQTMKTGSGLNLSFEIVENGMPKGWIVHTSPNYSVFLDSRNVKSGKYSIAIESTGDPIPLLTHPTTGNPISGQVIYLALPNDYDGEKMRVFNNRYI